MEKNYLTAVAIFIIFWAMILLSTESTVSIPFIVIAILIVWKYTGWKAALPVALTFLVVLVLYFYFESSNSVYVGAFVAFLFATIPYYEHLRQKKVIKQLFSMNTGLKADNIEFIPRKPTNYDLRHYQITGDALQVKIWSQNKAYKGLFDTENQILQLRKEILFPLYSTDVKPLWKEVTSVYDDQSPRQVEFRDSYEVLHGVDYVDQEGFRTGRSWRRHLDVVEHWNVKSGEWELS